MTRSWLGAALLLVWLPAHASAQTGAPTRAQGFDPSRLARVDSVLQRYVDEGRVAGAVGLVLRDGQSCTSAHSAGRIAKRDDA